MEGVGNRVMEKNVPITTQNRHTKIAAPLMTKESNRVLPQKIRNGDKISLTKFWGSMGGPD